MTEDKTDPMSIVTQPVRLAFPALFEPKPVAKGNPVLKYQAALLLPPTFDLKPLYECVKAAMMERWGKLEKVPTRNNPIKPCDEKELDGYEPGWHFINVKSNFAPLVVDQRRQEIIDPERIFAGCWVRAAMNAYAWEHQQGGRGVSFGLNAIQLVRTDTRLDGRKGATDMFEEIAMESDDIPTAAKKAAGDASDLFG